MYLATRQAGQNPQHPVLVDNTTEQQNRLFFTVRHTAHTKQCARNIQHNIPSAPDNTTTSPSNGTATQHLTPNDLKTEQITENNKLVIITTVQETESGIRET